MKKLIEAEILRNSPIADGVYELILDCRYIAEYAEAGQFVMVYLDEADTVLPRPFGICKTDAKAGTVCIIYRVVGLGTLRLSGYAKDKTIRVLGPCGEGFSYNGERSLLVAGGGLGAPILLELVAKICKKNKGIDVTVVLGFASQADVILEDEFEKTFAELIIATDDGSYGFHGNVTDALEANNLKADIVYACGPVPMLKAVCGYAKRINARAQISLEERMACGTGACCCCAVKVKSESGFDYDKVCKDGPVFSASEVIWDD